MNDPEKQPETVRTKECISVDMRLIAKENKFN